MTAAQMLSATKLALRIKTTDFDAELTSKLNSALLDLSIAGVEIPSEHDDMVQTACITYVRMHFGQPDNYDQLKASYDEQKGQLSHSTGYTDWLGGDT